MRSPIVEQGAGCHWICPSIEADNLLHARLRTSNFVSSGCLAAFALPGHRFACGFGFSLFSATARFAGLLRALHDNAQIVKHKVSLVGHIAQRGFSPVMMSARTWELLQQRPAAR